MDILGARRNCQIATAASSKPISNCNIKRQRANDGWRKFIEFAFGNSFLSGWVGGCGGFYTHKQINKHVYIMEEEDICRK